MSPEKNISAEEKTADREIVISRVFDAPRERVFEAMTDPKQVVKWWGPNGFTTTIHEMDVRPGGVWRHTMHGPDGMDYPNHSIFVEVVKPERIVYKHAGGTKEKGGACFAATWTFEKQGNQTKLTMRLSFASSKERDHTEKEYQAIEGGKQCLARLGEHLGETGKHSPAKSEFVISRTFDAPRELVWKVWTDTEHLKHWWGPKGAEILDARLDLRPGGIFHYRMRYAGQDMWGKFVFREVKPFEKMVWVNSFSDEKAGVTRHPLGPTWPLEMLTTLTFTEEKGKTTLTIHWTPLSPTEIERKTFEAGHGSMRQGWTGTFDQLTDYLKNKPIL